VAKQKSEEKKKRAPKPKILSMDEVYRLINRVQINKKEVCFWLSPEDAVIAHNVLKDVGLKYDVKELKTRTSFTIFPNPEDVVDEEATDIDIEFFEDEIPEEGSIF
jgi:hypothetical protein